MIWFFLSIIEFDFSILAFKTTPNKNDTSQRKVENENILKEYKRKIDDWNKAYSILFSCEL